TRMRETILYLRTCNAGTKEQCHIRTPFMIMLIQLNNNNINHLIPQFSLCCHHFLKIFLRGHHCLLLLHRRAPYQTCQRI
ncbi:hypothetical protein S83_031621, partial [Arachis hypogaea]